MPIYLAEEHESGLDDALAGADFTAVVEAIYAMASHDETLHGAIIKRMSDPQRANDALWSKVAVLAPMAVLDQLRSAITARVMGVDWRTDRDSWMSSYETLARFHRDTGGLKVPADLRSTAGVRIHGWLSTQRSLFRSEDYARSQPERLELLNKIGALDRKPREADPWMACYETLAAFHAAHGHVRVPADLLSPNGSTIRFWRQTQRILFRSPEHRQAYPERLALLDKIGAIESQSLWEISLGAFLEWTKAGSPKPVPRNITDWMSKTRAKKRDGKLSTERESKLIDAGFDFLDDDGRLFTDFVTNLRQFRADCKARGLPTHGFTKSHPDGRRLQTAAVAIRKHWEAGDYTARQIALLQRLGLLHSKRLDDRWAANLAMLKNAVAKNDGSFSLPKSSRAATFATSCRYLKRKGQLSAERVAQLDEIAFPWSLARPYDIGEKIALFKKYRAKTGKAWVDATCQDKTLLRWAQRVRSARLKGTLGKEDQARLTAAGFLFINPELSANGRQKKPCPAASGSEKPSKATAQRSSPSQGRSATPGKSARKK